MTLPEDNKPTAKTQALKIVKSPMSNPGLTLDQRRQASRERDTLRHETFPTLGSVESVLHIPMRDGYQSETRVFKPANPPASGSPLVVLMYGGGFVIGVNLQMSSFARALTYLYGATVVSLSYRLAPEHKFPTAPYDAWDSAQWLADHAPKELGVNLSAGFVLGGVSAGANLSIVIAHKALKEKLAAPITGIWACVPPTLSEEVVPDEYKELWLSREQNAAAPLLSSRELELVELAYQPDATSEEFTPFSPQALKSFAGIPRTYIQVAGLDPLRDDGLIYGKALRKHDVETRLDVYPGLPHAHFSVLPALESSARSRTDTVVGIGWLLGREADNEALEKVNGAWKLMKSP